MLRGLEAERGEQAMWTKGLGERDVELSQDVVRRETVL